MKLTIEKSTVKSIIQAAFKEDIPYGDLTTNSIFSDEVGSATIFAKEEGIIAGLPLIKLIYEELNPDLHISYHIEEGDSVNPKTPIVTINGQVASILTGERICLNFLQRMSGIATQTHQYIKAADGTGVKIIDTRKTCPGLRYLDKYAVKVGGAHNHRFGLSDAVMIKDNHVSAAGGITAAVKRVKHAIPVTTAIEVEVTSIEEVKEALAAGVDIIMLDNMSVAEMSNAIEIIGNKAKVEISGGVTLKDLPDLVALKPDFISVGALTHSVKALDLSMKFDI